MIHDYYQLTKPGIVRGNLVTATAGFLLASKGIVDLGLLSATLISITLLIASACVFNNYIDRGIDAKMARTKNRALVKGKISPTNALVFASVLGVNAFIILALFVNWLTFALGLVAFINYIIIYGLTKRRSVHGTLFGSISGAMPITAGYTAVTNSFDTGALLLFLILVFWQMPHFYAISLYRLKDYKEASLPVLPVKKGIKNAKIQIVTYILVFMAATILLSLSGYAGKTYLAVMILFGLLWLQKGLSGFKAKNDVAWARQMFLYSLIVLMIFSTMISLDSLLF